MTCNSVVTFACLVAMALACTARANSSSPEDRFAATATLNVEVQGKKIAIPRFRPGVRLTDERYAFDDKVVSIIKDHALTITKRVIIDGTSAFGLIVQLTMTAKKLKELASENSVLKKVDTSPRLRSGLGVVNGKLLENLLTSRKGEILEKVTKEQAQQRFEVLMEAIEKLVAKSNTGLVLVWPEMKVDGQSLEAYLKPSIQILKKNSAILGLMRLAAFLLKMTKDEADGRESVKEDGVVAREAYDFEDLADDWTSETEH